MHAFKSLIFFALLSMCGAAFSQAPIYAVYGMELVGPNGTIKAINVGIIPSGSSSDCQRQIDAASRGHSRADPDGHAHLLPSTCVFTVPDNLQPMVNGQPLADAYVLKQSGAWAPIYTAWYGLPINDPTEICNRLINGTKSTPLTSQIDVQCQIPARARRKIR